VSRRERRAGSAPSPKRRRWLQGLAVVVALAAVAGVVVSIRQLLAFEERKEVADAATVDAREGEADFDDQAADLEALIDRLQATTQDHLDTAAGIDKAVADILALQVKVDDLTARVKAERADRASRQQRIDVLLGCRNTLDAAIAQLAGGHVTAIAAAGVLGQGAARCQSALQLAQGDTGAVHPYNFADPSLLTVGDTYYAYATEGPAGAIQVLSSKDLQHWEVRNPALGNRPLWAKPGPIWAPAVHPIGGRYVLYYATRSKVSGQQCITTAVATDPAGPFYDFSAVPIICQDDRGGSIDPDVYLDPFGFAHLTWKSEDETKGGRAHLWTQALSADGLAVNGLPKELLQAEDGWEQKTIENPSMVLIGGQWVLFYSGGKWNTEGYAVGYALCDGATGPCHRPSSSRVHSSSGGYVGPGGADVFRSRGGRMLAVYAAWDKGKVGDPNARRLHVAEVSFHDGAVHWKDL